MYRYVRVTTLTVLKRHEYLNVNFILLLFMCALFVSLSTNSGGWICRVQWLSGRASDSRLREPGFESCAVVLKPLACFFTQSCSSSISCMNEYLAIDSGGYVYEQPSHINCSIWLDASQRSRDGV